MNMICYSQLHLLSANAADLDSRARLLGFDTQLLISVGLHMLTALALFYILARLLFKPVQKILDNRKKAIAGEFSRIQKESEAVTALRAEYEGKMTEIKKEAETIMAKARRRALEQESKIIDEARIEAQAMISHAQLEIKNDMERAKEEMRREIIEIAAQMAEHFVEVSMDDAAKDAVFQKALQEMGEDAWMN